MHIRKTIRFFSAAIIFLIPLFALAQGTSLPNPIGSQNIDDLVANIIKAVLGLTGSIALLMFVYGGFLWMVSGGNAERITKGKNIFIWATIGLFVIFTSYAILRVIFGIFG